MKDFIHDNFLLFSETARRLYHDYARDMPVIDYHCHLPPDQIAKDTKFENLTDAWLKGDHYKWRAMRTHGVEEKYCTGGATDREKFLKWSETVPYTLRNPLYHWTHLELKRYFGISDLLSPATAAFIYDQAGEMLQSPEFSVRRLLEKMKVRFIGTTDDPADDLQYHQQLREENYAIQVRPSFRPDKALQISDPANFNNYLSKLESVSSKDITSFSDFLEALKSRHDFFGKMGCIISDHGLEFLPAEDYTEKGLEKIFDKVRNNEAVDPGQQLVFASGMLDILAEWDADKGWVQQFHLGAMRNNNTAKLSELGPDTGWDSIGDFRQGRGLSKFLDRLNKRGKLAKTILYNLNPSDNELFAAMAGNFNEGSEPGKIQYGSGWWFLDQKDGMTRQLNALSNLGLISRFIGMLTDSRSFLSFPRHEYFRRILCNIFGSEIENGELPGDIEWTGMIIRDICYNNASRYFKIS